MRSFICSAAICLATTVNGKMINILYDNNKPEDFHKDNECEPKYLAAIQKSVDLAQPFIEKSLQNTDHNSDVWKKFFGQVEKNEERKNDDEVKQHMQDATFKYGEYGKTWNVLCCKNQKGACKGCEGKTLAYVSAKTFTSGPQKGTRTSNTWVRACKTMLQYKDQLITAGFVFYHELIHMTSGAEDGDVGYSKSAAVKLARFEPEKARFTANNYMLYAMQNSMSPYQYAKRTGSWGGSVLYVGCEDAYSNCPEIVVDKKNCCDTRTRVGSKADGMCCASCTLYQKTPYCQKELKAAVCIDEFDNCPALAANGCEGFTLASGDKMSKGCCKSCKGKGSITKAKASGCVDRFGNCEKMAKEGCKGFKLGNGQKLSEGCCKSCKKYKDVVVCRDQYSNCKALAQNGCENVKLGNGQKLTEGCCKACKNAPKPDPNACVDKFSNCAKIVQTWGKEKCGQFTINGKKLPEQCCKSCSV